MAYMTHAVHILVNVLSVHCHEILQYYTTSNFMILIMQNTNFEKVINEVKLCNIVPAIHYFLPYIIQLPMSVKTHYCC